MFLGQSVSESADCLFICICLKMKNKLAAILLLAAKFTRLHVSSQGFPVLLRKYNSLLSLAYYSQQHVHQVPGMVCIASQPAHPCLYLDIDKVC